MRRYVIAPGTEPNPKIVSVSPLVEAMAGNPGEPLVLWHGGHRWEGPPEVRPSRKGRVLEGPGLYLSTSAATARHFAKGGGSIIRLEIERPIRWLYGKPTPTVSADEMAEWVRNRERLRSKKEIVADIERYAARIESVDVPLFVLVNLMSHYNAIVGAQGPALANFLVEHGVDASLEKPGGDEDWVVLYNTDKVLRWRKVPAGEAEDAPRVVPNRSRLSKARRIFDECFDEIETRFPDVGVIELHEDDEAGSDNGNGSDRQYGYCKDDGDGPIVIAFAAKVEDLPEANVRGLMRHEFGHALEYRYDAAGLERTLGRKLPSGAERRADVIAEAVFGEPIEYDGRDVQCVGCGGKTPRPTKLAKNVVASPRRIVAALQKAPKFVSDIGLEVEGDIEDILEDFERKRRGEGSFAVVYDLPETVHPEPGKPGFSYGPRVLKITTDRADAVASQRVAHNGPHRGVVRIYGVYALQAPVPVEAWRRTEERGLYGIVADKVTPFDQSEYGSYGWTLTSRLEDVVSLSSPAEVEQVRTGLESDRRFPKGKDAETLLGFFDDLVEGLRWLRDLDITLRDVHPGNFGITDGAEAVFIDLGFMSVRGEADEIPMASNGPIRLGSRLRLTLERRVVTEDRGAAGRTTEKDFVVYDGGPGEWFLKTSSEPLRRYRLDDEASTLVSAKPTPLRYDVAQVQVLDEA